jgi:hypothetical protein
MLKNLFFWIQAPAAEEAPKEDHGAVEKDTKEEASGAVDTPEKSAPADSSASPAQASAAMSYKSPEDTKSKAKDPAAEVAPQGQQGPDVKDTAAATTEEAGDALSDGCKGNVTNQTGKESAGVTLEPVEAEQSMPAETEGDGDKAGVEEDRPGSDHKTRDADAQEDAPGTSAVAEAVPRQVHPPVGAPCRSQPGACQQHDSHAVQSMNSLSVWLSCEMRHFSLHTGSQMRRAFRLLR